MRICGVLCVLGVVTTSLADEVELVTGEVLHGELIEHTPEVVVLDHPILGRLEIPAEAVQAVRLEGPGAAPSAGQRAPTDEASSADDGRATAPGRAQEPAPALPPDETTPPEPRWDSKFEFGFGLREGATEDANLHMAFTTALKQESYGYDIDSRYALRTSRGNRSENKFTAGLFAKWPVSNSRWYYFAQTRYDFDEFQSWEHRITGGGGVGYHLVDVNQLDETGEPFDVFDLSLHTGAGLRKEFGSQNEDVQPEGIFGGDLEWHISPRQHLKAGSTIFPNLQETGEFRVRTNAEWLLDINTMDGISLKLGLAHEYQSQTEPGIDPNDLSVYGAVVIDF